MADKWGTSVELIQHKKGAGEKDTGLVSLKHLGGRLATYRSQCGLLDRAWCIFLRLGNLQGLMGLLDLGHLGAVCWQLTNRRGWGRLRQSSDWRKTRPQVPNDLGDKMCLRRKPHQAAKWEAEENQRWGDKVGDKFIP